MAAYVVRHTEARDWRALRSLRLAALRDPVAPLAFYEQYRDALRLPREEWQRRATPRADALTLVVENLREEGATLLGMVVLLARAEGPERHVQLVGVYARPEYRGTGLARKLLREAVDRAAGREVRLFVHERNVRAARCYAAMGFEPTGRSEEVPEGPSPLGHEPEQALEMALAPRSPGTSWAPTRTTTGIFLPDGG
ncbi:GNAT family N-acetyltransferase [Streptomyces sp. ST2-7A]|uniref:GNAT family N-acetyltransferase n=1 Tax=Streptomyces sp. ST2-7A TaxID=2907214 RepID=UPI001F161F5C|nr:GNAT family N-acetyltransferase [Streptomyces sp. ST2-7A]MCE7083359.1 GNAT family N-acetyltransferase [Streptomyces sp. ST2-7A]